MRTANCRSCGALIVWTVTTSGARMPVDAEPLCNDIAAGFRLFEPHPADGPTLAAFVKSEDARGEPLYRSHFATCPNADQHRKGRR